MDDSVGYCPTRAVRNQRFHRETSLQPGNHAARHGPGPGDPVFTGLFGGFPMTNCAHPGPHLYSPHRTNERRWPRRNQSRDANETQILADDPPVEKCIERLDSTADLRANLDADRSIADRRLHDMTVGDNVLVTKDNSTASVDVSCRVHCNVDNLPAHRLVVEGFTIEDHCGDEGPREAPRESLVDSP